MFLALLHNLHWCACRRDYRLSELVPGTDDITTHFIAWRCANETIVHEVSIKFNQEYIIIYFWYNQEYGIISSYCTQLFGHYSCSQIILPRLLFLTEFKFRQCDLNLFDLLFYVYRLQTRSAILLTCKMYPRASGEAFWSRSVAWLKTYREVGLKS